MTEEKTAHSHAFQAEVAELLNLMVHSVYSETNIFLRELISNASDACDKLRYEAIAKPDLLAGNERLVIRLTPDPKARTLAIAETQGALRNAHLRYHLTTLALLQTDQVERYARLRGYGDGNPRPHRDH